MFHEYRDIITKLKTDNKHFHKIFNEHNELHDEIDKAEAGGVDHIEHFTIEKMKKEKLKLKDEIYAMIIDYKKANEQ